jgi:hypothetical protein
MFAVSPGRVWVVLISLMRSLRIRVLAWARGTGDAAAQVVGELLRVILTVLATVWGSFASPVLSVSPPFRSPCPVPTHRCDTQRHAGNHGDPHDGRGRSSRRPVARECRPRDPRSACSRRHANMSLPGAGAARHPACSADATGQLGRRSAVRSARWPPQILRHAGPDVPRPSPLV